MARAAVLFALLALAAPAHAGWKLGFGLGMGRHRSAAETVLASTGLEARQLTRAPGAGPLRLLSGVRIQFAWDDAAQGVSIAWGTGR